MTVILHSGLSGDLRLAAALDRNLLALLHDAATIRTVPGALVDFGTVNDTGSDTKQVRLAGLDGYSAMSTTGAENTDVSTTALVDSHADIAVVRGSLRHDISDLASLTGFNGSDVDPERLALSMVGAFEKWVMSLVATAIQSAGTDVGSSGVDASDDDYYDAIATLELNSVPGPYFMMVHPRQLVDLQNSWRSTGGIMGFTSATADMLAIKGQGYAGSYLGVDIYVSDQVVGDGTNRHGAMWGTGFLGIAYGDPKPTMLSGVVRAGPSPLLVEVQRDSSAATSEIIGSGYCGVSIIETARGVGFVTDQ